MDVRIGVTHSMREIDLELDDAVDRDELQTAVEAALSGTESVFWLTDKRGRKVAIPSEKIAYIEIAQAEARSIGFGA